MTSMPIHFSSPLIMSIVMDLSHTLITKADVLAKQAQKYEESVKSEIDLNEEEQRDHLGSVVASIILSISYMESYFNKFTTELLTDGEKLYPNIDRVANLVSDWNKKSKHVNRLSIVRKFQYILEKLNLTKFVENGCLFQNADKLRKLRNRLVHYRPEPMMMLKVDLNTGQRIQLDENEIEYELKGLFPENPLVHPLKPFFPSKCLGSGCAFWSTKSARDFIDGFMDRLV